MEATILMVFETVKSFWKLVSKDSFPDWNISHWTCARHLETLAYVRVRTFSPMKQVKYTVKRKFNCRQNNGRWPPTCCHQHWYC